MKQIDKAALLNALSNKWKSIVEDADYEVIELQGGTVGDVVRIEGRAAMEGEERPFAVVLKTQRQWNRHGDPGCWRREYEIYKNGLDKEIGDFILLPKCYLLEERENETRIWMEHIEGATGSEALNVEELSLAARGLGAYQTRFHENGARTLLYLRGYPAVVSSYDLWWPRIKEAFSVPVEGFPEALRHVINEYGARGQKLLISFEPLRRTLCQGDVHHDNLYYVKDGNIFLIDWDSAGYGYMGEDAIDVLMEAFVYSDRDVVLLPEYRRRILTAYQEGARGQGVEVTLSDAQAKDLFALSWGFRIAFHAHYGEMDRARGVEILRRMLLEAW